MRYEEGDITVLGNAIDTMLDDLRLRPGQRHAVGPAMTKAEATMNGEQPDPDLDRQIADALKLDYPQEEWVKPVGT